MSTIQSLGVVGAGIMGGGIAQVFATAGLEVTLIDLHQTALEKGLQSIANSLDRLVKKEKITPQDKFNTLARIKQSTSYSDLKDLPLVIEAATENKELKEKINSSDKENIIDLISKLRVAISNDSYDQIKSLSKNLQDSLMEVGKKVYSNTPNNSSDTKGSADSVIDADFSETK